MITLRGGNLAHIVEKKYKKKGVKKNEWFKPNYWTNEKQRL